MLATRIAHFANFIAGRRASIACCRKHCGRASDGRRRRKCPDPQTQPMAMDILCLRMEYVRIIMQMLDSCEAQLHQRCMAISSHMPNFFYFLVWILFRETIYDVPQPAASLTPL